MRPSHSTPYQVGWRRFALIVGGCLAAGIVHTAYYTAVSLALGEPVGPGPMAVVILVRIAVWLTWVPFIPLAVWAARRYPLVGRGWLNALAIHLALFAAILPAMSTLTVLLGAVWPALMEGRAFADLVAASLGPTLLRMAFVDLVLYLLFVICVTAADVYRRQQAQRAALAEAELGALRARLRPHFLFNALQALAGLVRTDPERAADAVETLGKLLRYVLRLDREGRTWVSLDEEARFVQDYLALEQLKLGERLRVTWDVEDEALEVAVPPFTLQPLVENAVRYAVAARREGGRVEVRAWLDEQTDVLHLCVADDGPGADPAAVAASPGLGLRAVRRQLDAAFGNGAALEVETAIGTGFVVHVALPLLAALEVAHRAPPPVPSSPALVAPVLVIP